MAKSKVQLGGSEPYFKAYTPVVLTSDWTPGNNEYVLGVMCSGTGNLKVEMWGGGTLTVPIAASTGHFELRGYHISKIYSAANGTTVGVIAALL